MSTVPYIFAGNTGNIPLNALDVNFANVKAFANTAGYVTANAQANITSVGTLTFLSVSGNIVGAKKLSVTGNITTNSNISAGGNITTNRNISAVGNIATSGNILAVGNIAINNVSAVGNIATSNNISAVGNIATSNNISAVGTITGGNILSVSNISAVGNIATSNNISAVGNIATSNNISAVGNITGGNISAVGKITGGNITGSNITIASGGTFTNGDITFEGANIVSNGPVLFIDPNGAGGTDGSVIITGNLTVQGTTTTINSDSITTNDLQINMANNAATSAAANNGGIGVGPIGAEYATLLFNNSATAWYSSVPISVTGTIRASGTITGANISTGSLSVSGTSAFTGIATAPTAANGTSTTQIATTSFVRSAVLNATANLGTMSTQNATGVNITGGTISGLFSPLGALSGGTGLNSSGSGGNILISNGANWTSRALKLGLGTTGETWRDVVGSRAFNTEYTNSYSYPIVVSATATCAVTSEIHAYVNGALIQWFQWQFNGCGSYGGAFIIVPPGATYQLTSGQGVYQWKELY